MNELLISNLKNLIRKVAAIEEEISLDETEEAINRCDALVADLQYLIKIAQEEK